MDGGLKRCISDFFVGICIAGIYDVMGVVVESKGNIRGIYGRFCIFCIAVPGVERDPATADAQDAEAPES